MSTIALLATGDELTSGDVLNTNSQAIAQQLMEHNLDVGMHLVCSDEQDTIYAAINYLLQQHQALIITGGLGPTSDDRTRYALAKFLRKDLVFHQPSWDWIVQRLKQVNVQVSGSNQQQAMFPEGAQVLENHLGSANGCYYQYNEKLIVMLPGPPRECMPIFLRDVLPLLTTSFNKSKTHKLKWRVFGVSEGEFAERMDNLLQPYACTTAYRWHYPYIDFKVQVHDVAQLTTIQQTVDNIIATDSICPVDQTASEVLQKTLLLIKRPLTICDHATGGLLETKIHHPDNHQHVQFIEDCSQANPTKIIINGLTAYWQNQREQENTFVTIEYFDNGQQHQEKLIIPYRHQQVRLYAVELIAAKISTWLAQHF